MAHEPAIEKGAQSARQGRTGQNVRWVLGVGVILVIAAFVAVWIWG